MCVSLNVLLFVSFYGDAIFFSTVSDFLMKCKCTCLNKHMSLKQIVMCSLPFTCGICSSPTGCLSEMSVPDLESKNSDMYFFLPVHLTGDFTNLLIYLSNDLDYSKK